MGFDQVAKFVELTNPRRDGHHQPDICRPGAIEHGLKIALKLRKIEMTVAVDQHRKGLKELFSSELLG
jgi:hypothetical protein